MDFHLVCVHPIGNQYKRGCRITDPAEISQLMQRHEKRFVKVACANMTAASPREIEVGGVEYVAAQKRGGK